MITKIREEKVQIERGNEYERGENRGGYEDENDNGGRFYVCMYIKGGQQVEARTHPSFFITVFEFTHTSHFPCYINTYPLCNLITFLSCISINFVIITNIINISLILLTFLSVKYFMIE